MSPLCRRRMCLNNGTENHEKIGFCRHDGNITANYRVLEKEGGPKNWIVHI